jgi:hypothetical protein
MSEKGQSRHFRVSRRRSALAPIADIPLRCRNRRVGSLSTDSARRRDVGYTLGCGHPDCWRL